MVRSVCAHRARTGAVLFGISLLGTAWGAGLGQDVRVNPLDVMTVRQERPDLAISGSGTYAAWMDYREGTWDLYFARSGDGGSTFGPNRRVDGTAAPREEPGTVSIAAGAGDGVFLAWTGFEAGHWNLYVSRSSDGGAHFAPKVAVDPEGAGSRSQQRPALAVDPAGNLVVAWQDDRRGNWDLRCALSSDGGISFGASVRVDHSGSGTSDQIRPRLAVDSAGRLYVAWQDGRAGSWDVYTSKSVDGAATFLPDVRVDTAGGVLGDQSDPDIAIDGTGAPQVVWQDDRSDPESDDWRIYRARSLDGGQSFQPAVLVEDGSGAFDLTRPVLSFGPSGALYLGFKANTLEGYSLLVQRSDGDGSNPGSSVDLGPISGDAEAAGMAIGAGGSVAVIWEQDEDTVFARSTNGGADFSAVRTVNDDVEDTGLYTVQIRPSVIRDGNGVIHVVWAETPSLVEDPEWEILLASSRDGGRSFGPPVRVNSVTAPSDVFFPSPSLAVAPDGNLLVAWEDHRSGGWEIYVARSLDGGNSFGQNLKVNSAPPVQDYPDGGPSIAVAPDGVVYVAWSDSRQVFQTGYDVYLARSTDGGASFHPNIRIDDAGSGPTDQVFPSLAADAGRVFVAWQDGREGDDDIYLSRSLDSGQSFKPSLRVNEAELPQDTINQQSPTLALGANNRVFVAWSDDREGPFASHIYMARSVDGGTSFRKSVRVDDPTGETVDQRSPSLAAVSGKLAVAWQDARDVVEEDLDVYLAVSTDGGASFSPDRRVDGTQGMRSAQESPDLTLDAAGHALVAWADDRNLGNRDIYFTTDAPPPPPPTPTLTPGPTSTPPPSPTASATPTPTSTPIAPGDLSFLGPWQVAAGQTIRVPLVYNTGSVPLGAYLLEVVFPAASVEIQGVEGGAGAFAGTPIFETGNGTLRLCGLNAQSLSAPLGEVHLATLSLRGLSPGGSSGILQITGPELLGVDGARLTDVHPIDVPLEVFPPLGAIGLAGLAVIGLAVCWLGARRPGLRRLPAALLLAALVSAVAGPRGGGRATGDVDGDGSVTLTDAQRVQEALVGLRVLTPEEAAAADVDVSEAVELSDAMSIAQVAAGLVSPFPTQTSTPSPSPSPTP